jgi:hypothetical protein
MAMFVSVLGGVYFSYLAHVNPGHLGEYTAAGVLLGVAAATVERLIKGEKKKS